jgi:chitin-binding protein
MFSAKHHKGASAWKWLVVAALMASTLLFPGMTSAHGYTEESRGDLCRLGINTNCRSIDPADTEHPGTFPQSGAPDGHLASANRYPWLVLDEQSSTRWYKHNWSSGAHTFQWNIPAQHISDNFQYYITKPDWNPNAPLARSQFDLTPFCSVSDKGRLPGNPSHTCNIPARSGYHVILALWQVDYTGATFYSVFDVNFGGSNQNPTVTPTTPTPTTPTPTVPSGSCSVPAWNATVVYNYQDQVSYNGTTWRARWYTKGETPGSAQVWENIGACPQ